VRGDGTEATEPEEEKMIRTAVGILAATVCCVLIVFAEQEKPGTPPAGSPPSSSASGGPKAAAPNDSLGVPQFTIGEPNNVVRLAGPEGSVSLSATVTGTEKLTADDLRKYAETLVLIDRGPLGGTSPSGVVEFNRQEFVGRAGASTLTWRIAVRAPALPSGTAQVRQAQATLGSAAAVPVAFDYTITSKPAAPAQWELKGASPLWALSWSDEPQQRRYQIVIANQDEPIRNVRLVQSTLRDTSGRTLSIDRLRLMEAPTGTTVNGIDVQPNSLRPIFLEFHRPQWFGDYGTFDGQMRFAADGSAALKEVEVKVQASSTWIKATGVFLAVVGLALTALTAYLRTRAARLSALRTALVLAEKLRTLRAELTDACTECHGIRSALDQIETDISETRLDDERLLPPRVVFATPQPAADTVTALKTYLEKASNKLTGLSVLLREGIVTLKGGKATNRDALIRELDAAAGAVQGPSDARTITTQILAKRVFPAEIAVHQRALFDQVSSVADVDHEITLIAGVSWVLWGVVSLAIAIVWIVSDVDYGTPTDLIGSFLWGFGMTAFGAGIQGLMASGVATQVNLKLPG
jgi:hypothetical protein